MAGRNAGRLRLFELDVDRPSGGRPTSDRHAWRHDTPQSPSAMRSHRGKTRLPTSHAGADSCFRSRVRQPDESSQPTDSI
eukprot:s6549_g5.t1